MKKILLVSGCSMTDKDFISAPHPKMDCVWPKWPELLAKKLDMDCINLGKMGSGNEYIYSSLLEQILKKKNQIGLVIAAWSQCNRKDFQVWNKWRNIRVHSNGDVFSWVRKSLRYMISLQVICEKYNIPYKQFQMIFLFDGWLRGLMKTDYELFKNRNNPDFEKFYKYRGIEKEDRQKCINIMLEYEPYIDIKNFIGWPTVPDFGGYVVEARTLRYEGKFAENYGGFHIDELVISKWDQHPNEKGHQKIAEFLYDRLG